MGRPVLVNEIGRTIGWPLAAAAVSFLGLASLQTRAQGETDLFQQAVNYIFTGRVDPQNAPEIVDRKSCIIVLRDPNFDQYIRYRLNRFKMDEALFDKKYSGSRVSSEMNVKGDDTVVEYLKPDKKTIIQAYRSAQISLPGDIDQTRKALRIVFTNYCTADTPKAPF
jgi:hypothetical protein